MSARRQPLPENLPSRLQHLREAAGLTRAELAAKAGLTRQMVTSIEAGRRPNPSWATVVTLAAALDTTPDAFLG